MFLRDSPGRSKKTLLQLLVYIGPAAIISLIVMFLFFTIVYSRVGGEIIFVDGSITIPFFAMLALCAGTLIMKYKKILYGDAKDRKRVFTVVANTIIEWLPFPMLLFVYENLKGRIHIVTDKNYTQYLMDADQAIFGFQPTIAMQKIISPWLTDIMALCYATYFIIPFVSVFILYVRRRKHEYHFAATSIVLCFYLGYLGYIGVPCVIPKFFLREVYEVPLQGYFLHQFMDKMYEKANAAEIWGAFPSLHIAVSTLGLILAYHFKGLIGRHRLLFWLMLPIVVGLWVSTVYLRYHWTIDILAGWILAVVSFYLAKVIVNVWSKLHVHVSHPSEVPSENIPEIIKKSAIS